MKKRFFVMLLAVVLVFSLLPVTVLAEDDPDTTEEEMIVPVEDETISEQVEEQIVAVSVPQSTEEKPESISGECGAAGDNLTWIFSPDGTLTISGIGDMADYSYIGDGVPTPWEDYAESILSVVIESGVTSIGYFAFNGCSSLTSITIPESVTKIGCYAFTGCRSMESIVIPGSVRIVDGYTFWNCSSLSSVMISEGITDLASFVFYGCTSLVSITIPSSVKAMGVAPFEGASALTNISVAEGSATYSSYDGMLLSKDGKTLFCCPEGKTSVTIPATVNTMMGHPFEYVSADTLNLPCNWEGTTPDQDGKWFGGTFSTVNIIHNYDFANAVHEWSGDSCTISAECTECEATVDGHSISETVTIANGKTVYVKDTDATCTTAETGHYTATFENTSFGTKSTAANSVSNGNPKGHSYGKSVFTWSGYNCSAAVVCFCGDTQPVDCTVTNAVTKEPTTWSTGIRTYTATVIIDGHTYTSVKTKTIPKLDNGGSITGKIIKQISNVVNTVVKSVIKTLFKLLPF